MTHIVAVIIGGAVLGACAIGFVIGVACLLAKFGDALGRMR